MSQSAPSNAANKTSGSASKRTLVSYKDIQLSYLLHGTEAVAKQWKAGTVSRGTIRRAVAKLQQSDSDVTELETWVAANIGQPMRGRAAPIVGETRSYKAQQIKEGGPFLRLPLDSLGVPKGKSVKVEFQDGRIVVSQ